MNGMAGCTAPAPVPRLHCLGLPLAHPAMPNPQGVSFLGPHDEFVMSGSDCGHIYVWDVATGAVQAMLKASPGFQVDMCGVYGVVGRVQRLGGRPEQAAMTQGTCPAVGPIPHLLRSTPPTSPHPSMGPPVKGPTPGAGPPSRSQTPPTVPWPSSPHPPRLPTCSSCTVVSHPSILLRHAALCAGRPRHRQLPGAPPAPPAHRGHLWH